MKRISVLIVLSIFFISCAHVISEEMRKVSTKDVSFKTVRLSPETYKGEIFIWGGFIAQIKRVKDGTVIEVVQNPIDKYGSIVDTDVSDGRFLALYKGELDPLIYEKGRLVTIAGEIIDMKKSKRNGDYVYPVLEVKELYLWKEAPSYPYYYDRYYYDYYYPYYLPYYQTFPYYFWPYP